MSSDTALRHDIRSGSAARAMAGSGGTARQSRALRRHHRIIIINIGLSLLRERRFRQQVIMGAVVLAVLARIARENQARARARFDAWLDQLPRPPVPAQSQPGGNEGSG
jgi:hypothetical protein